jgi:FMN reductase
MRERSRTATAAAVALEGATAAGARTELLPVRELNLPLFDDRNDTASYPPAVWSFLETIQRADGLILASPVYHGTLSGAMKNALDFLHLAGRNAVAGKSAGLLSVAGGGVGTNTLNTLEYVTRSLRLWTVPTTVAITGGAFGSDGALRDEVIAERLRTLGRQVARHAALLAEEHRAERRVA